MKIKEESAIHAVNKVNIIQHKSYIPKQLKKTYWRLRDQLRWQYRLLTWRSWALPDFNIIGVMKSGTKSLFYDVAQQSQLIHSTKKEIRVSQKNEISWREQAWYRTPFYLTVLYLYDIGTVPAQEEFKTVARDLRSNTFTQWTGADRASLAKAVTADILAEYR